MTAWSGTAARVAALIARPRSIAADAFMRQQPALDADMEAVGFVVVGKAAQAAGGGDAVAGNHQRKPVGAASLADRARRRAHTPRDVRRRSVLCRAESPRWRPRPCAEKRCRPAPAAGRSGNPAAPDTPRSGARRVPTTRSDGAFSLKPGGRYTSSRSTPASTRMPTAPNGAAITAANSCPLSDSFMPAAAAAALPMVANPHHKIKKAHLAMRLKLLLRCPGRYFSCSETPVSSVSPVSIPLLYSTA